MSLQPSDRGALRTVPQLDAGTAARDDSGEAATGDQTFHDQVFAYLDASAPDESAAACTPGAACEVDGGCRRGQVACGPGGAVCVALGAPFTARSTSCGAVRACDGVGSCVFCGGADQPCCGTACDDGLSCGADGTCQACKDGDACAITGDACQVGTLSCGASLSCENPAPRTRGAPCGSDGACDGEGHCGACGGDGQSCCSNGCDAGFDCDATTHTCFACNRGAACVPENPCRLGLTACSDHEATCEAYNDAPRGTECGDGKACDGHAVCESCGAEDQPCCGAECGKGLVCAETSHTCVACDAGAACLSANGCRSGTMTCDGEGVDQCDQSSDVARSVSCGSGKSCDGAGDCVSCGGVGAPCCGSACDAGNVCDGETHTCQTCPQGQACLSADGCDTGTIECGSGAPVCNITGFATRGTKCGQGLACDGTGGCGTCGDLSQPCCDGACGSKQRCSPTLSCEGCPAGTVYVAGGTFSMGAPLDVAARCDVADADEAPVHSVTVESMCADLKEASVADWTTCADCVFPTLASPGMDAVVFADCNQPIAPGLPMNCVTYQEAAAYCASRDMRLPTEAEWEYLARGNTDARSYPWGDDTCDDCTRARFAGCGGSALPPGSLSAGASPFGLFDMAGNVAEWVSDRYAADFYASPSALGISPRGPSRGDQRVVRGGSYASDFASIASTDRDALDPTQRRATVGLRCVRSMP